MPNADTMGDVIRKQLKEAAKKKIKEFFLVESLGSKGLLYRIKKL
jgi:hypothetical protein